MGLNAHSFVILHGEFQHDFVVGNYKILIFDFSVALLSSKLPAKFPSVIVPSQFRIKRIKNEVMIPLSVLLHIRGREFLSCCKKQPLSS